MKKKHLPLLIGLIVVLLYIIIPKQEFIIEYLDNGELNTEVFSNLKDYNNKIEELNKSKTKYWVGSY